MKEFERTSSWIPATAATALGRGTGHLEVDLSKLYRGQTETRLAHAGRESRCNAMTTFGIPWMHFIEVIHDERRNETRNGLPATGGGCTTDGPGVVGWST